MDSDTLSDTCAVVDGYVGEDTRSVANLHILTDIGEWADVDILAYLG